MLPRLQSIDPDSIATPVTYKKYFITSKKDVGKPELSSAETVHANFGFYQGPLPSLDTQKSLGDLLVGFFLFYL